MQDSDKFHDECGVFGIYGHPEAPALTRLGLYALQHRGQESAGIATATADGLPLTRALGQVSAAVAAKRCREFSMPPISATIAIKIR